MKHFLHASADTVNVGYIDPLSNPKISIESGDTIEFSTWGHWGNRVTRETQITDFPALRKQFPKALGPHSITGPVHVNGAEPGDVLQIDILDLKLVSHGFNLIVQSPRGTGVLKDRFTEGVITHFELDPDALTTTFAGKLSIKLQPFLGIMGVAPENDDVISTVQPGNFGGNIDFKELVVGTSLFLPVFRTGAGFYCGDAHAVQGDGEVNQTAIETAMQSALLRLSVIKNTKISAPRAITKEHRTTLGFGETLEEAGRKAVAEMVEWLTSDGYEPEQAYTLCSLLADMRITQMVNGVVGVHASILKKKLEP